MRLVTYQGKRGPRAAVRSEAGLVDLQQTDSSLPGSLKELFAAGPDALDRVAKLTGRAGAIDPATVKLLAPIPDPAKVICIGLNYADHAAESGLDPPAEPVVFNKFPTAICADGDAIVLPRISEMVDYEAELVVVIGRQCRRVDQSEAMQCVAGYACGHDVSARDWQLHKPQGQWLLGKSFDTFAPLGPDLVTADEIADPHALDIKLRLNGKELQSSNTRQLIFRIDELISYVSGVCTLQPGDLIFTGTPPGVGMARNPQVLLQPGDQVEVEVEKLGVLTNPVVAEN